MRNVERAVDPYGPAVCPRCKRHATIFLGRYNLICQACHRSLADAQMEKHRPERPTEIVNA